MKLVGLTGGIACGKSTVSQFLLQSGIPIIDCDAIAHNVVQKGSWGYRRVLEAFRGREDILLDTGDIDREAVAALIFSDPSARWRLNQATHLPVLFQIIRQAATHWLHFQPVVIVDMPLLFETGFYRVTSPNVTVSCSPSTQLERLSIRDSLSADAAHARIEAQMPMHRKEAMADIVIRNDATRGELEAQVGEVVRTLRRHGWLHKIVLSPAGIAMGLLLLSRIM